MQLQPQPQLRSQRKNDLYHKTKELFEIFELQFEDCCLNLISIQHIDYIFLICQYS